MLDMWVQAAAPRERRADAAPLAGVAEESVRSELGWAARDVPQGEARAIDAFIAGASPQGGASRAWPRVAGRTRWGPVEPRSDSERALGPCQPLQRGLGLRAAPVGGPAQAGRRQEPAWPPGRCKSTPARPGCGDPA